MYRFGECLFILYGFFVIASLGSTGASDLIHIQKSNGNNESLISIGIESLFLHSYIVRILFMMP